MDGPEQYRHTILSKETVYQEEATLGELYGGERDWAGYAAEVLPIVDEVASSSFEGTGILTYSLAITGKDGAPIDFMGRRAEDDGTEREGHLLGAAAPLPSVRTGASFAYETSDGKSALIASEGPEGTIY